MLWFGTSDGLNRLEPEGKSFIARIEAGHSVIEIASCDLTHLVNDVTDMVRMRASAKGLTLVVDQSREFPRLVQTDARKLRQILLNLLGNAVKFTESGTVTLRLGGTYTSASDRWLLTLEVEDTGPGIRPEDQSRIFEPFVQAGKASRQKGTGLGLAITRQFVEMLGGSIRVRSSEVGSIFHVEIPAAQGQQGELIAPQYLREYVLEDGQPGFRVLVVDDDPDNRSLLEQLLRRVGFQVEVASGGAQAIEIFGNWRPQFIWTDLRMPSMDGTEMVRRIREFEGGKEVKIAAVSASSDATERASVLAANMDDFLRKPYRASEIFDCLAQHLGVRYIVSQRAVAPSVESVSQPLRPEDFSGLPVSLRAELASAVMSLDAARIKAAIAVVVEYDSALAARLSFHTERLAFGPIYSALTGEQKSSVFSGQSA